MRALPFQFFSILESMEFPSTFKDLLRRAPEELVKIAMELKGVPQNAQWHPEGNTLKHVIVVFRRALERHPDNRDIALSAFFHDLGKLETLKFHPKTGEPTAYGHEDVSADLVKKHVSWIKEMGGNPANVYYIVKNHMKMKPRVWDQMRNKKKEKIKAFRAFKDLDSFSKIDRGGLD